MDKEHIFVNIRELQKKITSLDERLSDPGIPVSALDLDTQLMYLRLMYDSYLSLRAGMPVEGKKRSKGKKDAPSQQKIEEPMVEQPEEQETSLPLPFADEGMTEPSGLPAEPPVSEPEPEPEQRVQPSDKADTAQEEKEPEAVKGDNPAGQERPTESSEAGTADGEKVLEQKTGQPESEDEQNLVEVDINLEDVSEARDIDLNAIEFEDEPEDDFEEEASGRKKEMDDTYGPYYPGLNPKAMDGEPEIGLPTYSGKSSETLGEHFAHRIPSLNDQLSRKKGEDRSIGGRKQRDQINDLTKSIDLNLKFTFVRELFNGNAKLLTEELNNLNDCARLESALSLFEEMKRRYRWKEEVEAVQQLYELILRKFAR
jgi:hypothetical protein